VQRHGLAFLTSYEYTQDNWLLSLVPLAFAQFSIVGVRPFFVVISGWAIFVTCTGLTLWLARGAIGRRLSLALLPFLLLCNENLLGWPDFLGYPITHNISLLWGLVAVLLARNWLVTGRITILIAASLALVIDGISDPWAMPAFVLPMVLGGGIHGLIGVDRTTRIRSAGLAAAAAAACGLCLTKCAGLLRFLPAEQFQPASWYQMNINAVAVLHIAGTMFSPFAFLAPGWPITDAVTATVIAVLTVYAGTVFIRCYRDLPPPVLFVIIVSVLSIAGVTSAFILSVPEDVDVGGRFFFNVYVFLPVLIGIALRYDTGRSGQWGVFVAVYAALVVLAGICSQPSAWAQTRVHIKDYGTVAFAAFLQANGLHRGYGDYFGTQSSAVTWVSHGRVLLRPVSLDPHDFHISPRARQASPFWYGADEAARSASTFVVVGPVPLTCAVAQACIAGLTQQFGAPAKMLSYRDMKIMVWNRPLALSGGTPP
jgi:hypothetical protein